MVTCLLIAAGCASLAALLLALEVGRLRRRLAEMEAANRLGLAACREGYQRVRFLIEGIRGLIDKDRRYRPHTPTEGMP